MPPLANRIEEFVVTVTPLHSSASPLTQDISVADGNLQRVEITVPAGHNGLTGIQILAANAQLIPRTPGQFLVANDRTIPFDLVGVIDTGSFQVKAFNNGIFVHSFYITLHMLDFAYEPTTGAIEPLPPTPAPV